MHKVNLKCNRKAENDNRKWINKITKYKSTKSKIQNIIFCFYKNKSVNRKINLLRDFQVNKLCLIKTISQIQAQLNFVLEQNSSNKEKRNKSENKIDYLNY